jgi:hypothetical protein
LHEAGDVDELELAIALEAPQVVSSYPGRLLVLGVVLVVGLWTLGRLAERRKYDLQAELDRGRG